MLKPDWICETPVWYTRRSLLPTQRCPLSAAGFFFFFGGWFSAGFLPSLSLWIVTDTETGDGNLSGCSVPLSRFGLPLDRTAKPPPVVARPLSAILSNRPRFPLELGDQQADVETLKGMLFLNTRAACLIH